VATNVSGEFLKEGEGCYFAIEIHSYGEIEVGNSLLDRRWSVSELSC